MPARDPVRRTRTAPVLVPLVAAVAMVLAACGGSSSASEVASLAGDDVSAATSTSAAGGSDAADPQQAALDFAQCMRDNGVDVPDPTFDAEGNPTGGVVVPRPDGTDDGDVRAAVDACRDLLDGAGFGLGGGRFDREEMQAAMVEFTQCLRDEGLDVGDLQPGGPGGQEGPRGDGSASAQGDRTAQAGGDDGPGPRSGGFDPTARLIEVLGLDPDDPAVVAAMDTCQPKLEEAFQSAGPGGPAFGSDTSED